MSNWQWHKDWRLFWALLFVGPAVYYVPEFFEAGGDAVNELAGPAGETIGEAYDAITDAPPAYEGPTHVVGVTPIFEVNPRYHHWGQLFQSFYQLPEISGRVYAERADGARLQDAGLRALIRRDWHPDLHCSADRSRVCRSSADCRGGDRCIDVSVMMTWTGSGGSSSCGAGRDPDGICVLAPDLRLPAGQASGWRMCVELHEGTEGHNLLGAVQNAASYIRIGDWQLSEGDLPVAAECVEITNRGYPRTLSRTPVYRYHRDDEEEWEREAEPMGWIVMRFDPPVTPLAPLAGAQTNWRTSWRD